MLIAFTKKYTFKIHIDKSVSMVWYDNCSYEKVCLYNVWWPLCVESGLMDHTEKISTASKR